LTGHGSPAEPIQPAASENMADPTPKGDTEFLRGEIVAIEDARVRVRLDSGSFAFLPRSESGPESGLVVGRYATFRVAATGADGSVTLALAEHRDEPDAEPSFDRDVHRLHDALANHHPITAPKPVERISIGEEQIQNWLHSVETKIGRIRKNRAKRLNEEFYNS